MSHFKLTPAAINDLREVAQYTEGQWGKEKRNEYLAALDRRFVWLADNPQLGKNRDEVRPGLYSYPEGSHVIFYRSVESQLQIIGILHQNMDFKQHL